MFESWIVHRKYVVLLYSEFIEKFIEKKYNTLLLKIIRQETFVTFKIRAFYYLKLLSLAFFPKQFTWDQINLVLFQCEQKCVCYWQTFKKFCHHWDSNPGTSYPGHSTLIIHLDLLLKQILFHFIVWTIYISHFYFSLLNYWIKVFNINNNIRKYSICLVVSSKRVVLYILN